MRFKTCRLLPGNVRNRELSLIQRRILRRLRNKRRSIKEFSKGNLLRENSNIKSQTTRKLPLYYGDLPIIREMHRERRTSRVGFRILNQETRSDVIPVRLHFSNTLPQARQPISHRRVCVNNGLVVNFHQVSHGDLISFLECPSLEARGEEIRRSFYIDISVKIGKFLPVRMVPPTQNFSEGVPTQILPVFARALDLPRCKVWIRKSMLRQFLRGTQKEEFQVSNTDREKPYQALSEQMDLPIVVRRCLSSGGPADEKTSKSFARGQCEPYDFVRDSFSFAGSRPSVFPRICISISFSYLFPSILHGLPNGFSGCHTTRLLVPMASVATLAQNGAYLSRRSLSFFVYLSRICFRCSSCP